MKRADQPLSELYSTGQLKGVPRDWIGEREKKKKGNNPMLNELLRVIRIHFGQGVFACDYCIDYKAGYCEGQGYQKYQQVFDCINKKHFGGIVKC